MKVLICYYSTYGNVYKMANLVAEGVSQVAGAEPVVRTVPELIPAAVIESRADMKAGRGLQEDIPRHPAGHGGRLSRGRRHRLRDPDPIRQRVVPAQEPD